MLLHLTLLLFISLNGTKAATGTCNAPVKVTAAQLSKLMIPATIEDCIKFQGGKAVKGQEECSTVEAAAQGITAALEKHKIMSLGQAAAGIVWMAGVSRNFVFNNKPSDTEGDANMGTYSMRTPDQQKAYAQAVGITDPAIVGDPVKLLSTLNSVPADAFGLAFQWIKNSPDCAPVLPVLETAQDPGAFFSACTKQPGPMGLSSSYAVMIDALACEAGTSPSPSNSAPLPPGPSPSSLLSSSISSSADLSSSAVSASNSSGAPERVKTITSTSTDLGNQKNGAPTLSIRVPSSPAESPPTETQSGNAKGLRAGWSILTLIWLLGFMLLTS